MRDLLGVGCATIDELLFVESYPAPDTKTPISRRVVQGGGLTATALVAAARLGANCAYAGSLGHDDTSREVEAILQAEKINTSLVGWHDDAGAIRAVIIVDETHQTRTILMQRPKLRGPLPDATPEAEIANSRVLLVDHYGGEELVRLIQLARKHKIPVVADFERADVPNWDEFFPLVDHLVISRGFALKLTGETEVETAARALWNPNRSIVIITAGDRGGVAFDGREITRFSSPRVEVVDTTGCGDVFHGVYAATLAWNFDLKTRLRWSSTAAALSARHEGAQAGAPSRAELALALEHESGSHLR